MTCRPDGLRNVLMGSEANEDKNTEQQLRPGDEKLRTDILLTKLEDGSANNTVATIKFLHVRRLFWPHWNSAILTSFSILVMEVIVQWCNNNWISIGIGTNIILEYRLVLVLKWQMIVIENKLYWTSYWYQLLAIHYQLSVIRIISLAVHHQWIARTQITYVNFLSPAAGTTTIDTVNSPKHLLKNRISSHLHTKKWVRGW